MPDHTNVILDRGGEDVTGIAPEGLPRKLQKPIFGRWQDMLNGEPGVINSVFAAHKVLRHQRTIHPGQYVIVHRVHLAESRAHLATSCYKAGRQGCKGDVAFFQIDSRFAERKEEVSSRVWIDNRLQAYFRFVHLERWRGINGVMAQARNEVADYADVRIQRF